jgi:hydrogenase-4 membrane subunit HyfE
MYTVFNFRDVCVYNIFLFIEKRLLYQKYIKYKITASQISEIEEKKNIVNTWFYILCTHMLLSINLYLYKNTHFYWRQKMKLIFRVIEK